MWVWCGGGGGRGDLAGGRSDIFVLFQLINRFNLRVILVLVPPLFFASNRNIDASLSLLTFPLRYCVLFAS